MMTNTWQKITSLPAGGAVFGISCAKDRDKTDTLWLCSPAGLFFKKDGQFFHQLRGIPFRNASAVLALDKNVLAAGYPNQIVRSPDGGQTWFGSRVEQANSVVTCFAVSPNFDKDAILLAGSDGDGVLRSTDGGNSWGPSNFGLRSRTVLDIACAPTWGRASSSSAVAANYEMVFAATEAGVFLSPNAGRAWRFAGVGLPPAPILSIAASPDFSRVSTPSSAHFNGAVFAGTDGAGLYRSLDAGQSWQALTSFPAAKTNPEGSTFNTLCFNHQGVLFAGTGDMGILASPDLGETWLPLLDIDDAILCLAVCGTQLLAGTAGHGLLVSDDDGRSWQPSIELSARYVSQITSIPGAGDLLVSGFAEGLWVRTDSEWRKVVPAILPPDQPVIALRTAQERVLALTPDRLLAAKGPELDWGTLIETSTPFTLLTCDRDDIYLGNPQGEIRHSRDGGKTWREVPQPAPDVRLLSLLLLRQGVKDSSLYAAVHLAKEAMLALWRFDSEEGCWEQLFQEPGNWQTANLAHLYPVEGQDDGPEILLVSGNQVFIPGPTGWQRKTVTTPDAPVTAVFSLPGKKGLLLAKQGELLLSHDRGETWEAAGFPGKNVTALAATPDDPHQILALTSDGGIFGRKF